MADKLTPQQHQAVIDRGGNLLVSAAAGSGKTKVLVDRLLSYLTDPVDPANIDEFLIITYTKAAAAELREKIANKLTEKIAENPDNKHLHRQLQRLYLTTISTVHSFCSDILRQYAYLLDLPGDFSVMDERDAVQIQSHAMEQVLENAYASEEPDRDFLAFLDSQGFHRNDQAIPPIILDVSTKAMCHFQPEVWLEECIRQSQVEGIADASETIWGKYLIDDLHQAVALEADAFAQSIAAMEKDPEYKKPCIVFSDIYYQLQALLQANTWDAVIAAGDIQYGTLTFPKSVRDNALTEQVKAVRNACKKHLQTKLEPFSNDNHCVMADLRQSAAAVRGLVGLVKAYHQVYGKLKRSMRTLDFSDLEHFTLDLLYGKSRSTITAAAKEIAQRYRQIMVDEYQDSNAIQDAIFRALCKDRNNLFMVGDVKQSIYQFRLADPEIFLEKYAAYAPAGNVENGHGRKVLLSSNFRSGGGILNAANDVFSCCMSKDVGGLDYTDAEALVEGIPHIDLPEPEIQLIGLQTKDESNYHEARMVAGKIQKLLDGTHFVRNGEELRTVTPEDIVILLRSPGTQGPEYKAALEEMGIPCADDLQSNLFDAPEIGVLRSILSIISNPRQDIPLVSALVSPVFGLDANDLAQIRGNDRKHSIYERLQKSENEKVLNFFAVLSQLRKDAKVTSVAGLLERIYLHTNLDSIYGSMADGALRMERLESFYSLAVSYDARGMGNLEEFLSNLDIMEEKGLALQNPQPSNCVRIMSIHKSKGLEYPIVFLCSLSKRFNTKSLDQKVLLDKQLGIGLCCADQENRICYPSIAKSAIAAKMKREMLSEEMRILYVAMTRPRDRLIMTFSFWKADTAFGELALRMSLSDPVLLHSTAKSLSAWVLYTALRRTEAGALFAYGAKPEQTRLGKTIWDISIEEPIQDTGKVDISQTQTRQQMHIDVESIRAALTFRYPYELASHTPSKQTATQLKERYKDAEISENTSEKRIAHTWRKPAFVSEAPTATHRGNAIHTAMQYMDFSQCTERLCLEQELQRLVDSGLLSAQQRQLVAPEPILTLFQSSLGQKLLSGQNILREFKFSVLTEAEGLTPEDKILLQGVVDCAILEEDGIVVIDFKSDRVTVDTLEDKTRRYAPQVDAYAKALSKIFSMPIKEKWLYFFTLDQAVAINEF